MHINVANRPKGSLSKVLEKYITLAQDASSNGDRIVAENYYQYAEHYQRLINQNGIKKENKSDDQVNIIENSGQVSSKPSRTQRAISATNEKIKKPSSINESQHSTNQKEAKKDFTSDGIEALKPFEFSMNRDQD